jgi:hypothetical protein
MGKPDDWRTSIHNGDYVVTRSRPYLISEGRT